MSSAYVKTEVFDLMFLFEKKVISSLLIHNDIKLIWL